MNSKSTSTSTTGSKKYWLLAAAAIVVLAVVLVIWQRHSNITESELRAILAEAQPGFDLGDESLKALRQAERLDIRDAIVWLQIGSQLCVAGHYEQALSTLERSRRYPPPAPGMYAIVDAWEGIALDAMGRRQEAISAYTRSLGALQGDDRCDTPWFTINRDWVQQRLTTPFSPSMIGR